MPLKDDDFEIIEETINDFEFFYDEEKASKRNRSVIIKYRLMSVLIAVLVSVFLLTVLGVSRMKAYGTDNVLTKDEMIYIESKKELKEIYDLATEFFVYDSNFGVDTSCTYADIRYQIEYNHKKYDATSFYETLCVEWAENLTALSEELSEVKNPKKKDFTDYITSLSYFIEMEKMFLENIRNEENFNNIISGNTSMDELELPLIMAYTELATLYNEINN